MFILCFIWLLLFLVFCFLRILYNVIPAGLSYYPNLERRSFNGGVGSKTGWIVANGRISTVSHFVIYLLLWILYVCIFFWSSVLWLATKGMASMARIASAVYHGLILPSRLSYISMRKSSIYLKIILTFGNFSPWTDDHFTFVRLCCVFNNSTDLVMFYIVIVWFLFLK